MYYFGTSLTEAGHYFWELNESGMMYLGLKFPVGNGSFIQSFKEWPFNPEDMPRAEKGKGLPLGKAKYYRENDYTICAIEGSCYDKRGGSKSVFFERGEIRFGEFALKIMSTPIAKRIIQKMPFQVDWGLNEEYTEKIAALK